MIYLAPQLVLRTSEQPAPREYTVSTAPTEYKAVAEQSPPHRSQRAEPRHSVGQCAALQGERPQRRTEAAMARSMRTRRHSESARCRPRV